MTCICRLSPCEASGVVTEENIAGPQELKILPPPIERYFSFKKDMVITHYDKSFAKTSAEDYNRLVNSDWLLLIANYRKQSANIGAKKLQSSRNLQHKQDVPSIEHC
jgi:hypothetical protein